MDIYVVNEANETKFERFKRKVKAKALDLMDWIKENKEMIVLLTPVAVGGLKLVTTVAKSAAKHINLSKEESVKNMYCYDPSLGHYWALKRELTNKEWLDIDRRRKNGERMSEILEELRVLK